MKKHFSAFLVFTFGLNLSLLGDTPHFSPGSLTSLPDELENSDSEICDPSFGKYMKLPFFDGQPLERKCSVVKTVKESAEEVASELGIAPPTKINDVALKFVGENGLPPKEEKDQEDYFGKLWGQVSPLIPENAAKRTQDDFKRTVLAKVQEETKSPTTPSIPSAPSLTPTPIPKASPNSSTAQEKPRADTDVSIRPKQVDPEKANHPPAAIASPVPATPDSAGTKDPAVSTVPRTPSTGPNSNPATLASTPSIDPFRRTNSIDSLGATKTLPKLSIAESAPALAIGNSVGSAPNRPPLALAPEIVKLREPLWENETTPKVNLKKEILDLAAKSIMPRTDSPKIDLSLEPKIQAEEKTKPLAQLPKPLIKDDLKPQNKSFEPTIQNGIPGIIQSATWIPFPQNQKSFPTQPVAGKEPKRPIEDTNNKAGLSGWMSSGISLPPISSVSEKGTEPSMEFAKGTPPVKFLESAQQPVKNVFSDFIGFAKNQLGGSEASPRTISSVVSLGENAGLAPISSPLKVEKVSYLPWLTFLAGSVGTFCFLIGLSLHLRKKRSKSSALAVVPRRIKHLN